jgi:hypothetical protein
MNNNFIVRNYRLKIVWILVVLIGVCFMGNGCRNPLTAQEAQSVFVGTWKLTYSKHQQDSVFVNKAFLVINKDSTFNCNASFLLRRDSSISQSISGTWGYLSYEGIYDPQDKFSLISEKLSASWYYRGGVSSKFLELVALDDFYGTEYHWVIVN